MLQNENWYEAEAVAKIDRWLQLNAGEKKLTANHKPVVGAVSLWRNSSDAVVQVKSFTAHDRWGDAINQKSCCFNIQTALINWWTATHYCVVCCESVRGQSARAESGLTCHEFRSISQLTLPQLNGCSSCINASWQTPFHHYFQKRP